MEDDQGISGVQMEEIMEESIRIFWEFVRADKDETPGILKGFIGTHVELQSPSDFDLLEDIQADLYKVYYTCDQSLNTAMTIYIYIYIYICAEGEEA